MSEIPPRLQIWSFPPWWLQTRASAHRESKEDVDLCSNHACRLCFLEQHLFLPGFTTGLRLYQFSSHQFVSVRLPERKMKLLLLWIANTTTSPRPKDIRWSLATRTIGCLQKVFLASLSNRGSYFIRQNLLVLQVSVGSGCPSRFKLQTTRWLFVDISAPLFTRTSNTERNKSMCDRWPKKSLHQECFCISLCWKKVFMIHSVLLQQSCGRRFPLSLLTSAPPFLPITPLHTVMSLGRGERLTCLGPSFFRTSLRCFGREVSSFLVKDL